MFEPGDNKNILTHTHKLGNLQFANYLKSQPNTVQLIFSIEKYLQKYPSFYYSSLLIQLKGRPLQDIYSALEKQYNNLINNTSFIHKINACIQARMKCINKIRRDISKASKFLNLFPREYYEGSQEDEGYVDWLQIQGYTTVQVDQSIEHSIKTLSNIFVDMYRLRDMSIYIVETVHEWRMRVQEQADRCHQHTEIHYYFQQKSLYESFFEDTGFIWVSKLNNYIWMQSKQDPFLIRNVIHVEQREKKTLLQKYFLQILSPKTDEIIDKSLRCFQMLLYKFKPKLSNLFQEEQMLIENYLKLQMDSHMFDQQKNNFASNKNYNQQQKLDNSPTKQSPIKRNRLNARGWVFEKNIKKDTRARINQIVQSHKKKMNNLKPYNITNEGEKNTIALAYLSQIKEAQKKLTINRRRIMSSNQQINKNFHSQGQDYRQHDQIEQMRKGIESQPEIVRSGSSKRMLKSLTKLHPIILQDPKQHLPDTPKHIVSSRIIDQEDNIGRKHSIKKIKFNSFAPQNQNIKFDQKIEIQEEETPLNFRQFFQVFRADTTQKIKNPKDVKVGIQQTKQKIVSIKQFLQKSKKQRYKSLPHAKKQLFSISMKKKRQIQNKPKNSNSYSEYVEVVKQNTKHQHHHTSHSQNQFIILKAKSIPYDLITPYVRHIFSQQHTTSKTFSAYQIDQVIKKLSDPFVNCIIFDLRTQKQQHIGQVVLSESLGGRGGKLKYTIQFLNIQVFELIIASILRISEELLSATPCEEVVCPFYIDKLDLISNHFIQLIDRGLTSNVQKFGRVTILERAMPSLKGTDVRQRLYIFTTDANFKKQYEFGLKMMGNYRSLKFECKCLVLTSNFRLRSKGLWKDTLTKYNKLSIGQLFVRMLGKIMTKYHLRQLKQASLSLDAEDELVALLKNDIFLRNVIQSLVVDLKNIQNRQIDSLLLLTGFSNMNDLLHYLHYKKHDDFFNFQFLEESRFILNHQLVLVQFDQQLSLQFYMTSDEQTYIMHNNKQLAITMLKSNNAETQAYLLPTTNQKLKILIMKADQFQEKTNDQLDLYSYLSYFFKSIHSEINLNQVPAIVLPNLKTRNLKINKVRMFEGFFKLFPQRQFYSAAMLSCLNHWQSYYPNAVIHPPSDKSLVFDFPFIIGFYDTRTRSLQVSFLYKRQGKQSP